MPQYSVWIMDTPRSLSWHDESEWGWIEVTGLMWRHRTTYSQAVSQAIKKEKVHEYEIANKQIGFCFLVPNSTKKIDAGANEHTCTVCRCTPTVAVTAPSQKEIPCKHSSYGLIRPSVGFSFASDNMVSFRLFPLPTYLPELCFSNKQHLNQSKFTLHMICFTACFTTTNL